MKDGIPSDGVVCYLAGPGEEPCLSKIEKRSDDKALAAATLSLQGKETIKATCIGILLAKARFLDSTYQLSWFELEKGVGSGTWVSSFVQNFQRSRAWWDKRASQDLHVDESDFPIRGSAHDKSYSVSYNQTSQFWSISNVHFVRRGQTLDDADSLYRAAAELEDSQQEWTSKLVPRPKLLALKDDDLERLAHVQPGSRRFFCDCRNWLHGRGCDSAPTKPSGNQQRRATNRKAKPDGPSDALFPEESSISQRAVAQAHIDLTNLLRNHGRIFDEAGDSNAFAALTRIAEDRHLPIPLLYDLRYELSCLQQLPPLEDGYRSFKLCPNTRPVADSIRLPIPLLEPDGEIEPDKPLRPRAFMGWLNIEKVAVPKWSDGAQAGERTWTGGNVYGAPVFELLDQDQAWRKSLAAAVQYVKGEAGQLWPADHDFRWSLGRTDGGEFPSILLSDHLGAAFAFALASLAGIEPFKDLIIRGDIILGSTDPNGALIAPSPFAAQLFHPVLEKAAHAHLVGTLFSAPPTASWPSHWAEKTAFPLRVEHRETLRGLAEALRPASLVVEEERKAAEKIEIIAEIEKVNIEDHYEDLPLFREVPSAELRKQEVPVGGDQWPRETEESPVSGARSPTVSVLTVEECLAHKSGRAFEDRRIAWRELFSNFAKLCPQAATDGGEQRQPHFVVIGAPGTGKSTFAKYLVWLSATGRDPFGRDSRMAVRISLRDWEAWGKRSDRSFHLQDFLAAEHPASRGFPIDEEGWARQWDRWLHFGRLILLLDGLDEIEGNTTFVKELEILLSSSRKKIPVVILCRSLSVDAYRSTLTGWPVFTPAGLSAEQRAHFIESYPRTGKLVPAQLERQLTGYPDMLPLAENPLLLSVVCFVADKGLPLSATRHELFDKAVPELLARNKAVTFQKISPNACGTARKILAGVAANLFGSTEGLRPATTQEYDDALEAALPKQDFSTDRHLWKQDLKKWFKERSGLIRESRVGAITFLHNQFLEFLAGEGLAAHADFGTCVAEKIRNVDRWREVIKYAAGQKLTKEHADHIRDLLTELAGETEPATDLGWQKVVLAGEVILYLGTDALELNKPAGAACLALVRQRLVALIEHESLPKYRLERQGLSVHQRAHAGEVLGKIGDPRPGVGVKRDSNGTILTFRVDGRDIPLPDFGWCGPDGEVSGPLDPAKAFPAGEFMMGGDSGAWNSSPQPFRCTRIKHPFFIAKYPVTWEQFQSFVDADGYGEPDQSRPSWWPDTAWNWRSDSREGEDRGKPRDHEAVFQTPNHPRVGVSLYEIWAFVHWLNRPEILNDLGLRTGARIGLTTEAQWELAAGWNRTERMVDGRIYAWGSEDNLTERCNWEKTGIGHTTAVGLFRSGQADCGAFDLCGNVWEWCQTKWSDLAKRTNHSGYNRSETLDDEHGDDSRVLRGGSWVFCDPADLRAALRSFGPPGYRCGDNGFRLVVVCV